MANIIRMSVHEFEDKTGVDVEDVMMIGHDDVKYIHMSVDEENPFVGVEYNNGSCSIVGCGMDYICSFDEMLDTLSV